MQGWCSEKVTGWLYRLEVIYIQVLGRELRQQREIWVCAGQTAESHEMSLYYNLSQRSGEKNIKFSEMEQP